MELNEDGSMKGKTFSGENYKGEHPRPKVGKETYSQYYDRVELASKNGFHKGDLSWGNYHSYCLGFDGNDECRQGDIIE